MAVSQPPAVPMTVIAGYFGAGKTSYINHLIRRGLTPNTVILVNDFGEINVDAGLIEYREDSVIQLQNGCICCTLGGTLAETMTRVLGRQPRPAAVIIEASGIARPGPVADVARVSRRLRLGEVACLVDCQSVAARLADKRSRELVTAQITESDTLLLNKLAGRSREDLQRLREALNALHPGACIVAAPGDMVPSATNSATASRAPITPARPAGQAGLASFTIRCRAMSSQTHLETLLRQYADVLIRAKGTVAFHNDPAAVRVLQYVNGDVVMTPTARRTAATQLVCIGYDGQRLEALRRALVY